MLYRQKWPLDEQVTCHCFANRVCAGVGLLFCNTPYRYDGIIHGDYGDNNNGDYGDNNNNGDYGDNNNKGDYGDYGGK
jgi:hypothetical protein